MKITGLKIKGITCDSRKVKKGFVFVAIKGNRQDGSIFIKEAVEKGAQVVVVEAGTELQAPKGVKILRVKDCRKFLSDESARFFGYPSKKLKITGITGTNGKTTVSYLVEAIAKNSGFDCGVIGTINYRFNNKAIPAKNTTPACCDLQQMFAQMLKGSVKYCAMEVSSHALDQKRAQGIDFNRAIFTNLTQDHLDYHKDLESYFQAKARLFRSLPGKSVAIINNDDKYGRRIPGFTKAKIMTYGIKNRSTVEAKEISLGTGSSEFTLSAFGVYTRIKTNLVGIYNIYNLLAAICWGLSQGLKIGEIKLAIEKFKNVPGRMEKVSAKNRGSIFVDYAHTPDALYNATSCLKAITKGRLILIFGCGGERDRSKRPKMGKVATDLADYVIITSDNPRSEDPAEIIREIEKGINKNNYCTEVDRAMAIKKGLSMLSRDDCLLIAGKGHESYQLIKGQMIDFSDGKEVRKCLASMK